MSENEHYTTIDCKNRTAWLGVRRERIHASDVPGILGLTQYASPRSVWLHKVDPPPAEPMDAIQEWGLRHESAMASKFQEETGLPIRDPGDYTVYWSKHWPWLGATIDREIVSVGGVLVGILECKTAYYESAKNWQSADTIPMSYVAQITTQMLVAGTRDAYFAVLCNGYQFTWHKVEFSESLAKVILKRTKAFWERYVLTMEPPPVDDSEATSRALAHQYDMPVAGEVVDLPPDFDNVGARYDKLLRVGAKVDKHKLGIQNRVKDALGNSELGRLLDGSGFSWAVNGNGTRKFTRKQEVKFNDEQ